MATLEDTLTAWNNLDHEELVQQWKFLVLDNAEPVGYILDDFAERMIWDTANWHRDPTIKVIRLEPTTYSSKPSVDDCNQALVEFCEQNQDVKGFGEAFGPWVKARRYFHPVLTPCQDLKGLVMPSPARGILGINTAGVHMNVYTSAIDEEGPRSVVDRIWVAKRSQTATYPGCFDQIVAGAMDPADNCDPIKCLKREATEEAMWKLEDDGLLLRDSLEDALSSDLVVGDVHDAGRIYFCTKKDASAGLKEAGHIEPGVRFCFDVDIKKGTEPVPNGDNNSIGRFFSLSVDEVIRSLENKQWKPNSGLVMLDFLHRKGLIDEKTCKGIGKLSKAPPLALPEFQQTELHQV
jgi:hypothetical protein